MFAQHMTLITGNAYNNFRDFVGRHRQKWRILQNGGYLKFNKG